jgi:predicted choloylglycine hydrolase
MTDCYRGAFGCSSLLVDPPRSKTGGPLVARNLDFYDLGYLHRYSLVTVYRPKDKHAFASIGFAGVLGCLSGMNDAGLGLAVHEVFLSRDGAPLFNPRGTPYTLLFRRILEECTTIAEAEKLLRGAERTTMFNLALCDRSGVAVVEATPKSVVTRRGENGLCACTNHFRSPDLATILISLRYRTLMQYQNYPKLDLADLTGALKRVAHPRMTIHAMIFEPATLRAHVALGRPPATDLPLQPLELGPLFAGKPLAEAAPAKTENKK